MYDKNSNTMPYRFGVKMMWFDNTRSQVNFHTIGEAKNKLSTIDYGDYLSVSLIDRQNQVEIKYILNDSVEVYINNTFAGDVRTTFHPDSRDVYAFTAVAHSPNSERSISRDFVSGDHILGASDKVLRLLAIEWVQVQHCNLALGEL